MTSEYNTITFNKFSVVSLVDISNIRQKKTVLKSCLGTEEKALSRLSGSHGRVHDQAQHYRKSLDFIQDSCRFIILSRAFYDQREITGSVIYNRLNYLWSLKGSFSVLHILRFGDKLSSFCDNITTTCHEKTIEVTLLSVSESSVNYKKLTKSETIFIEHFLMKIRIHLSKKR